MTHGSNSAYVSGCRCNACTRAAREYLQQYRRRKIVPLRVAAARSALIADPPEPHGSTGNLPGKQIFATAIRVWCRCGNSGYANPWIVGKSRRIESCEACR